MRSIIPFIALFLFCACKNTPVDTKAEGKKLMQLSREWSKSASTDSIEKTLSYWAEDAVVMAPGQPPLKGKEAIRQMVMGMSKIPGFKISWEPISVFVTGSGELAYMLEQNQITVNDSLGNPITEFNKSVTIWKKDPEGSWKNVVDMWNAQPPPNK
jgi:ketosteroid isomerase-like protein